MFIVMPESIQIFFKKYATGYGERSNYISNAESGLVLPDKIVIHRDIITEDIVQIVTKDYAGSIGHWVFIESIYHKKPYDSLCDILERNEIRYSGLHPVKV